MQERNYIAPVDSERRSLARRAEIGLSRVNMFISNSAWLNSRAPSIMPSLTLEPRERKVRISRAESPSYARK